MAEALGFEPPLLVDAGDGDGAAVRLRPIDTGCVTRASTHDAIAPLDETERDGLKDACRRSSRPPAWPRGAHPSR